MQIKPDHFLLICETCEGDIRAEAMHQALAQKLPADFEIRRVNCMAGCERPTTVGFQAEGKAQYLFGDILSDQDVEALVEFAGQYRDTEDGWTNATQRPRALYDKTLARLPRIPQEDSL
ncbi:DUF1636 family protein [Ruegeria sp. R14_0]|uniref:DUF1636 family protein n=1 Tax=Ruegeria sp. R14_0 TaxID=2821100 RepID=UPI001ADD0188|nr:DUF1636 family protein [Ruegeria sp. R14_0]MBO9446813.1 DUF1636 domain-containing protein [Ruegeria sp. R14_0]